MIPAIPAQISSSTGLFALQAPVATQATLASSLDTAMDAMAQGLLLGALLAPEKKDDNADRMALGELLMFGSALTGALDISRQLNDLFAGITALSGISAIGAAQGA